MPIPFVWPAGKILRLLEIPSQNKIQPKSLHIVKDSGLYAMTQTLSPPKNKICYAKDCDPTNDSDAFISTILGESDLCISIPREEILDLYHELLRETKDTEILEKAFFFMVEKNDRIGFGFSLEDPRPFLKFNFMS